MIVDRSVGVKRDNDDDSSKPKKTQRKELIDQTDAEQPKSIAKSLVTSKPPQTIRKRLVKKV